MSFAEPPTLPHPGLPAGSITVHTEGLICTQASIVVVPETPEAQVARPFYVVEAMACG
jgi:hypothetical protein